MAAATWILTHRRSLVATAIGTLVFASLYVLYPRVHVPGNLLSESVGALIVDLLGSAIVTALFWVGYALIGHKVQRLAVRIGMRPCEKCQKGNLPCPACGASGTRSSDVAETSPCPTCKGTAIILANCSQCSGARVIVRPAKYASFPGAPTVRFDYNPLHWGHYEDVAVTVTNTDETDANYSVAVDVFGGTPTKQVSSFTLPPRQSVSPTFTFKVHGASPLPVHSVVFPSPIQVLCPACLGSGRSNAQCPECQGSGKISVARKITVACQTCSGTKVIRCLECGGSGLVRRVE
jgi:hypothetical protein